MSNTQTNETQLVSWFLSEFHKMRAARGWGKIRLEVMFQNGDPHRATKDVSVTTDCGGKKEPGLTE